MPMHRQPGSESERLEFPEFGAFRDPRRPLEDACAVADAGLAAGRVIWRLTLGGQPARVLWRSPSI
jgi:hypothetical protein